MRSFLPSIAHGIEQTIDALRYRLQRRRGYTDPIAVQPYRGYGTTKHARASARVLEDEGGPAPSPDDTAWENFRRSVKMLETDEVPGAKVRVRFAGQEKLIAADEEGYVLCDFDAAASPGGVFAPGRPEVAFELIEPHARKQEKTRFQGEIFIPRHDAQWVIVSDVDDTVLHTQATSLVKMAVGTLFSNAYGRIAFPGVAAFYRALHKADAQGKDGRNPIFYLTSSPWNVYDMIKTFCEFHGLPAGPLLMRDLGVGGGRSLKGGHEEHKLARARELLELYPEQRFILIGDTGQHDAEIYLEVCRQSAARVLAVYLRDVSAAAERDTAVAAIVDQIRALGVPCVAAEDTIAHARHAAQQGWIGEADLHAVRGGTRKDEREGAG